MAKTKETVYKLPVTLKCDPAEIENGIDIEIVHKVIKKHQAQIVRYEYLKSMYDGFHGIFDLPSKDEWKPDNRLAVGFPEYLVTTFQGYAYGIAPKIAHPDESINDSVQSFLSSTHFDDFFYELTTGGDVYGHCWAYLYQDEETQTKITHFTPKELFCVYDDTLKGRALFAVRYGVHGEESKNKGKLYGEVLTADEIKPFEDKAYTESETKPNPYGMIPVVECRLNDRRKSLFEAVCGMTELYNKALSEKGNDVDAFAEAYLAIIGVEVNEEGYRQIRDKRLINIFGTNNADKVKDYLIQFLQKPTADETQENLLDRLERLIFQVSMVANISDESFANAASGEALAYKLWNTSNLGNTYDRKNTKTIEKIFKIWCSLSTNCSSQDAWKDIEVTMTRNLPKNLKSEADVARSLEGVVSKETQLKVLSIVDDPAAELERIDEEEAESMAQVTSTGGFGGITSASTYEITSLLRKLQKDEITRNNAIRMFKHIGLSEDEAVQLMDDRNVI